MTALPAKPRLIDRLAAISDGAILRTAFYALLAGTLSVLWIDYQELGNADPTSLLGPLEPVLPAFDPTSPDAPAGPGVTTDFETLKQPLTIALGSGGVLKLQGTIEPGSATRFAEEVEARGEYVTTVVFDSPGGSVDDAIAIGALISLRGFTTSVEAGGLCASSCPLAFAGGKERLATPASAIGVHQFYAALAVGEAPTAVPAAGEALSNAQRVTARITRHLVAMGVDQAVWLHALETPPDRLYYLSPDELVEYKLVTKMAAAPAN
jgi:hypothetical protein